MTTRVTTSDREVGRLIAHHRKRKGILQRELADAIGICHAQISRYECGHEYVSLSRRTKIAAALGVDPLTFADPMLEEVTPDERDLLSAYRRIQAPTGRTSVLRVMAAIESAHGAPSC
ncbi:helix-turn-helix transcriptional regulator [Methylobacterium sp. W2]|uniref:helix-turn-helix domain-containing protein n=1 Tax=Methylobacterium sp. W2 TaxID=2598107 RepID=UPI001D0C4FAA|nr:helix-turn-helix transcriptional regulator [Methylobacterium sp. W2]MCC0809431.1 helix-turn-helix transcriptional regulator [Methylobacterium sp. W2]